jgi:sRNA-binding carbon storage regulator CsrA
MTERTRVVVRVIRISPDQARQAVDGVNAPKWVSVDEAEGAW